MGREVETGKGERKAMREGSKEGGRREWEGRKEGEREEGR